MPISHIVCQIIKQNEFMQSPGNNRANVLELLHYVNIS